MTKPPAPARRARSGAQIVAADPGQSVWVAANAGTGKTQVLIDRIMRLLLAGTAPSRILCLTFTKAAAAEMAIRLSRDLDRWTILGDAALADDLKTRLNRPATKEEAARARRLFAQVLDAPEGLRIRTIHSFCESLLGRFPIEAGLAPHFTVADERTAAEILADARKQLLEEAGRIESTSLSDALARMASLVDENGFTDLIKQITPQRERIARLFRRHNGINGAIAASRRALGLAADDDEARVLADAANGADELALRAACAALAQGQPTDITSGFAIQTWLDDRVGRATKFLDFYVPTFVTTKGQAKVQNKIVTNKVSKPHPDVLTTLLAEQERVTTLLHRFKAVRLAQSTATLLALGAGLLDGYEAMKGGRALLDYEDLIGFAHDLLAADGGISWVHYKLDGGIDHVLVDEAQDNSRTQWNVIAGLAADFFAGESVRETPPTVFAVGDQKQSIFSFQGADPDAFAEMRAYFEDRAAAAALPWKAVELAESYRSTQIIVSAVDTVFAAEPARAGLTADPTERIRHLTSRAGQAGLIEIWPTLTPGEARETDPWDAPLDRVSESSPQSRLARKIADRIAGWLRDKEMLPSAGRPIQEGDIMILLRTRGRFAEEMVRALKERDIRVAGSDRMVLTEQIAVMDLIALGRFALLPEDDLNLAVVLKTPLFAFDDKDLFELAHGRVGSLWAELRRRRDKHPKFADAHLRLTGLLARADFAPPFEFYSQTLGPERGRENLLARLGPDAADPIAEFLALALEYEREHAPSLQGFLHWIESGKTQIKRDLEHGRGEVRVMTVHGAKGLQSNIVFLPDTCTVPDGRSESRLLWGEDDAYLLWAPSRDDETPEAERLRLGARARAEREHRRLLYVALTRARDRLYLCGFENKKGRGDGCWYDLVASALAPKMTEVTLPGGEKALRREDPQTAPVESEPPTAEGEAVVSALPPWATTPAPPAEKPPKVLAPSRPEESEPPVRSPLGPDGGQRFRRGILIHRLLQTLPDLAPERRTAAAERWLARAAADMAAETRAQIAAEVLAVLDDPAFADLFGPASRAEVPLTGAIGESVIAAQVDRLLVAPDAVTVIDFKTHRPPPARESDVAPLYLRQMAIYRTLLAAVFPGRAIRCALLWTDGPTLMALSDSILAPYALENHGRAGTLDAPPGPP